MAPSRSVDSSSWLSKPTSTSNIHPSRGVTPFRLDRRLLAKRSARVAALLIEKPNEDACGLLHDIPGDAETFELVARFCHGFDVNLSTSSGRWLRRVSCQKGIGLSKPLGEPARELTSDRNGEEDSCRKWKKLASLPLHLYEPIIQGMIQHGMPPDYVAGSLLQYIKRWICSDNMERSCSQREVIEAVERLLPSHKNILSCTLLFEMLSIAINLDASFLCKNGFEISDRKTTGPGICQGSLHTCLSLLCTDASGLARVAKLMEEFLAEAASDGELKPSDFLSLADLSVSASEGTNHCPDGIYRAVDIYLDKHRGFDRV
ncbi:hypothetical protein Ancab_037576 [Ancistrocladus abbreviatus]